MEIGVHHGRLFILLALCVNEGEDALGVDLFDMQDQNVDQSGKGDFGALQRNLERHAGGVNVRFLKSNSLNLGGEFCRAEMGKRFVSIDGGHTRAITANDLWIAQSVLCDGGIVALDDIYRVEWSGVTAGLAQYFARGGALVPIAIAPNKLFLTTSVQWADTYRKELQKSFIVGSPQEFFEFDRVDIIPMNSEHEPGKFGKI
ncbi:class I SAM-dependent methyltransferase [Erythrobacter tepidarius]|uniref:class I SAM-dependent methyltransferase n=1 Tax=Erythrobacter tepidarius TaxID=60454 RepID=UPI001302BF52|nr:class I SAM-dependent methyltransferase [Erythrobacter tepidarius]